MKLKAEPRAGVRGDSQPREAARPGEKALEVGGSVFVSFGGFLQHFVSNLR